MKDRGMIKWAPFNSVISNKEVINSLIKEKSKIKMPTLSEDEITELEGKIINAYYESIPLKISYYKNGYILNITARVKKIDCVSKTIYLNNTRILFNQILSISYEF